MTKIYKKLRMAFHSVESKKEDFRKYLETSGVVDQLTRVLVALYEEPEKPANPIEFIKRTLGSPSDFDVNKITIEYEKAKHENQQLKIQIEDLKNELESMRQSDD